MDKKNKHTFALSMNLIDQYIKKLISENILDEYIIVISSSMGQEANKSFDNKYLSMYDGKIIEMNKFIDKFKEYTFGKYNHVDIEYERNMAPQYGFKLNNSDNKMTKDIILDLKNYMNYISLKSKIDQVENAITLTIDPYTDINLQKKLNIKQANKEYKKYGFHFDPINDHHSGSHSPVGVFAIINGDKNLESIINNYSDDEGYINYLKIHEIFLKFFKKKSKNNVS